jgi:hypothetical protein
LLVGFNTPQFIFKAVVCLTQGCPTFSKRHYRNEEADGEKRELIYYKKSTSLGVIM